MKAIRAVALGAWAALAWGQQANFSLQVEFDRERPVDRVLARVDPARDVWIGEQDYQEIGSALKAIAQALIERPQSFAPLARHTADFGSLSLAEFKIVATDRTGATAGDARIAVRVELGGEAAAGGLLSKLGAMDMSWAETPAGWQLRGSRLGSFRDLSAARPAFKEVTEEVFGRNEALQKQLNLGIDHWRDTLDAAVGVTVYGHQGLSLGDIDGDGLDDLYVSQPSGLPNRLFRNNGNGTFSDVSRRAGLDVLDETSMALFGDLDNDGDQDAILIGAAPLLFRNDGSGSFLPDRAALGIAGDRAAMFTGAALADYDLDGDLDLYVCAYGFWQPGEEYDAPAPYYDAVNGPPNLLLRNDGTGRFEDVSDAAGLGPTNDRFSFAAAWGDYDDDGDPDLYVANDFGRNNLYRNNGDGTLDEVAAELGVEDLGAGMSAAWGDYDADGDLDLYTANMWSSAGLRVTGSRRFLGVAPQEGRRALFRRQAQGNSLFRNDGERGFSDVSDEARVRMGRWAWAADFVDLDTDGWLDLFVQNGYITGERADDL